MTTAGLELLEITPKGRMVIGRPPDTGLFMIGYEVEALVPALAGVKEAGFARFSGPVQVDGASCAIVEGPSGILVLLQEKKLKEGVR